MPVLNVRNVSKTFDGLAAVANVDIAIEKGELVGLIGPNGAGKTTVFNLLTGVYAPSAGTIRLDVNGKETQIQGKKPYDICAMGIGRTFQNIRLFKNLSVLDNVRIAMHHNTKYGLFHAFFHTRKYRNEERELKRHAEEFLKIFGLEGKLSETARSLPYGEQRHLEIARALATKPALLLLDEPAAGMNPAETAELTKLIHWIRDEFKITILLIEHDMSLVMNLCERIYVLDYGMVIAEGSPDEIKSNKRVIEAYLGEEVQDA